MFPVKKKGKKKKLKDSPPKSSSSTSTSTTSTKMPKVEMDTLEENLENVVLKKEKNEIVKKEVENVMETNKDVDNHGPEAGQEPAGPDQNLPVSAEANNPPSERKATSYINVSILKFVVDVRFPFMIKEWLKDIKFKVVTFIGLQLKYS